MLLLGHVQCIQNSGGRGTRGILLCPPPTALSPAPPDLIRGRPPCHRGGRLSVVTPALTGCLCSRNPSFTPQESTTGQQIQGPALHCLGSFEGGHPGRVSPSSCHPSGPHKQLTWLPFLKSENTPGKGRLRMVRRERAWKGTGLRCSEVLCGPVSPKPCLLTFIQLLTNI